MDLKYRALQQDLKTQILSGIYREGDLLPSEKDLSESHRVTRNTVRQALSGLEQEGYIRKMKGKGSIVIRHHKHTLGVLSVKGFTEILSEKKLNVETIVLDPPVIRSWPVPFFYPLDDIESSAGCVYLKRIRCAEHNPVMLESTYIPDLNLPGFCKKKLIEGSLFKTLNINYGVEITHTSQDLRAIAADPESAGHLRLSPGTPLLHIYLRFSTNREHLNIYSSLLCNTENYSIGNKL